MKRNFVYITDRISAPNTTRPPPSKKHKSFGENDLIDDDDLLDAIGTQALEQFESNNDQLTAASKTDDRCTSATILTNPNYSNSSNVPSKSACTMAYRQENDGTTKGIQLELALKQITFLERKVKLLQDDKYSQVGEVKFLREKLNRQAESNAKELALQQAYDQSKLKWMEKEKDYEERIASLSSKLKFKEQEASTAHEKCKYLELQNKISEKEIPPSLEEVKVQSDIKVTPVSTRCSKNAQRNLKNFVTEFPTSDPLSKDTTGSGSGCNKKIRIPQHKAVNTSNAPMHSTPLVNQETQTPVDVLQHGRIDDGVTCVELNVPSMGMSGQKLFNNLMSIYPRIKQTVSNERDKEAPVNVLSLIYPQNSSSVWLSTATSTHKRDCSMEEEEKEEKGEEDKANYFVSLELPASTTSSPFLRDPLVQHDLQQSLANLLGSPHLLYPEQNFLRNLETFGLTRGDSGITLLLVLERLVGRYCLEKTKGQDGQCRSVESWVSGSLEALMPSFASPSDETRVGQTFRDPMRMDNAQAIVRVMEVLLELVRHSKPVRCHILDSSLGIPSKPPLGLSLSSDKKWMETSNNGRITPCVMEQADSDPVTMECDNGPNVTTDTLDTSVNCISYLKHHTVVPLGGKLSASQRPNWIGEMVVSISKKLLVESNSDTSVLSSVIGSCGDHSFSDSTSFMQQGSTTCSGYSYHSSNLFSTLLHLMEPSHKFYEEETAVISNALEILVVLAQDCSEHQMECYLEPALGTILRSLLCRGQPRMRVMVIDLLYHLSSSLAVINSLCSNNDSCPLLQAYELLTNPLELSTDTEYGLKVLQMVAKSVSTGNRNGGKPMFIFDFDCCCSSELISGLLAFSKRVVKSCVAGSRGAASDINYEVISQMILALLPVIVSQDIGDDITHNDAYKHDYTEVVKGLSMVLLHCASPSGKWEQAVSTLKELLDYDDLQDCLNATCDSAAIKKMATD